MRALQFGVVAAFVLLCEIESGKKILRGDSFYNPAKQVRVSDRLWAAPDTAPSWRLQQELGIDWINTDHLSDFATAAKN